MMSITRLGYIFKKLDNNTHQKVGWAYLPNKNVTKKRDKLKSINLSLFLKLDVGNVLSSQEVALQVFSPLQVFTTVFGMGTGGLPAIGHQQTCRLLLPIILGFSYTLKIA